MRLKKIEKNERILSTHPRPSTLVMTQRKWNEQEKTDGSREAFLRKYQACWWAWGGCPELDVTCTYFEPGTLRMQMTDVSNMYHEHSLQEWTQRKTVASIAVWGEAQACARLEG